MNVDLNALPVITAAYIFHVGSEPCSPAPACSISSLEGPCLSVSYCPDAWVRIAKLGGWPWWELKHSTGRDFKFVDCYSIGADQWREMMQQAVDLGLLRPITLWRAWSSDEEEDWQYSLYSSREEAEAEVGGLVDAPEGCSVVEAQDGFEALPRLISWWSSRCTKEVVPSLLNVEDAALLFLCENFTNLDGVWFDERLDVSAYSAPRGALFQRVIPELACEERESF